MVSDLRDDWVGVYEVWWAAKTRYPELRVSSRLAIAEHLVYALIRDGSARLAILRSSQPSVKRPGEHPRVSASAEPIPTTRWPPSSGSGRLGCPRATRQSFWISLTSHAVTCRLDLADADS